jgi:glycosyltransferase involved in cell wall biosynthesis
MATHNGSRFILEALQSVRAQDYHHLEILVVDDASTDATARLVNEIADRRIRLISNEKRLGLTMSLNRGLKEARGEYIARIDDDDVWPDPRKLARQVAFLESHPRAGLVGAHNIVIGVDSRELYRLHYAISDEEIRQRLLQRNQFPHSSVLLRRSALQEAGFYDEQYRYAQDFELWLRLGLRWKLANVPGLFIQQRINPRGVTSRKSLRQFLTFVRIAHAYRHNYPGFWRATPGYGREFFLNLFPKKLFYRLGGWRRRLP